MAVILRLTRGGSKKRPYYKIVAADSRCARDGKFLDDLGRYNPLGTGRLTVDQEKVAKWLSHGAQVSSTVKALLKRAAAATAAA